MGGSYNTVHLCLFLLIIASFIAAAFVEKWLIIDLIFSFDTTFSFLMGYIWLYSTLNKSFCNSLSWINSFLVVNNFVILKEKLYKKINLVMFCLYL